MTQDVRSDAGDLAPGEQVAGYQIQAQIGRGGMAIVYRALDLRLGRHVALKVLAPQLARTRRSGSGSSASRGPRPASITRTSSRCSRPARPAASCSSPCATSAPATSGR